MKKLDLNAYGVTEMNQQEMMNVEGGSIFTAIGNAINATIEAIGQACVWVYDNILSKPLSISF
jgi:hypothetical protein